MKPIKILQIVIVAAALPMAAGATPKEKSWTGTLTAVRGTNTITVADAVETRTFGISTNCAIVTGNNKSGTLSELQPGEHVIIQYRRVQGELVAERITEKVQRCTGTVDGIVPTTEGASMLELKSVLGLSGTARAFRLDSNCEVVLRNGESGTLENVKPGDEVTILYIPSDGGAIGCQVEDTSRP